MSKRRRRAISLITALFCARLVGVSVLGANAPEKCPADQNPPVEARANEWLKRMSDYLSKAPFFTVNAEIWQDIQLSSGQQIQAGRTIELEVQRPNHLHAQVISPRRNRELVFDGASITLFNKARNFYGTIAVPGNLDAALDTASDKFGIEMPLADFIGSDPRKDLLEKVVSGEDIGQVNVMGVPCEHLAFNQENIDWQVWIEKDAKPIPRKFVITYKDEPGTPQYTAIFTKWDFTTKLPDYVFKFEPPDGAMKIDVKEMKEQNQARRTQQK